MKKLLLLACNLENMLLQGCFGLFMVKKLLQAAPPFSKLHDFIQQYFVPVNSWSTYADAYHAMKTPGLNGVSTAKAFGSDLQNIIGFPGFKNTPH